MTDIIIGLVELYYVLKSELMQNISRYFGTFGTLSVQPIQMHTLLCAVSILPLSTECPKNT